jgi:iron complex outermembrane receptor protein
MAAPSSVVASQKPENMKKPTPASFHPRRSRFSRTGFCLLLPALGSVAFAQEPAAATTAAEEDVIKLSAFRVSEEKDSGYRASNSIAGTRSNTPIKDIPLNIQVFTKDLYDDLVITNQIDLERYNAALVNGNADIRSSNPIQQSYNAFLFRGFVQNWGLRDGIRQYDPVDTQGLARVEIVKGPAGPLYGLSYAGGVMNSVTKDVDFLKDFTSLRFTVQNEGEYRATIDANYAGDTKRGKFGIRFNGAHAETVDEREHSDGSLRYSQLNLAWQPYAGTELKFLMENGYRGKTNGLGYFTRNETDGAGNALNNGASIPLQIDHPEIPWEWNWATGGNIRSIDTDLYRGTINQTFNENFSATAYVQFAERLNIDSNGWDAQGSNGGASWDTNSNTGWINPRTPGEFIRLGYHYRDWGNRMHGYGATGIYKVDLGPIKNVITFGANVWSEKFLTRRYAQPSATTNVLDFAVRAGVNTTNTPTFPPADFAANTGNGGWNRENNSNDYYFIAWQGSLLENRLKLNAAANRTNIKLVQYDAAAGTLKTTEVSKTSPMFGAMFDVTKQVSVFAVYSSSLFPSTDKNSFSQQMPPEVGKSYEGGVKVELLNGKISGTVSVYQITKEGGGKEVKPAFNLNVQRWDAMSPAQRLIEFPSDTRQSLLARGDFYAAGEQESTGFEADLIFQPTSNWQILLSYANNDTEVTASPIATELGRTTNGHIDQQLAMLTKYSFTDGSAKGLSIGAGFQYAGEALQDYGGPGNTGRYNPDTIYGELFAGYRFKFLGFDSLVQLNVKNITEQEEFIGWKATGSASRIATERYEVSTPMVYSLTFGVDF